MAEGAADLVPEPEIHRAIEAVWRIESARLIGGLTRVVRDVGRVRFTPVLPGEFRICGARMSG